MLTPQNVKDFWAYMQSRFGSVVVSKNESEVMRVAAALLDTLDIQDKETFMKNFVTTLGATVYIPFQIGMEEGRWPLWGQVRVCVHEHQHILQGRRDGWLAFGSKYLTSSSFRAGYEAEAFGCDLEMEFWRTGQIIDIDQRASVLKSYGCSDADIDMVKQMLTIRAGVVGSGAVETRSAQIAIEWLETNVEEIGS